MSWKCWMGWGCIQLIGGCGRSSDIKLGEKRKSLRNHWLGGGGRYNTDVISLTGCRPHTHLILLLGVTLFCLVFYILWYRPSGIGLVVLVSSPSTTPSPTLSPSTSLLSHNITYPSPLDTKQEPAHTCKQKHSDDPLVALLASLKFRNYGIVKRTDNFIMQDIPCLYGDHYYCFFFIISK